MISFDQSVTFHEIGAPGTCYLVHVYPTWCVLVPSQSRPYTVRTGDTMRSIAEKRKVPLETLLKMNHDVSPDALVEGQRLQLPVGELSARDQEILVSGFEEPALQNAALSSLFITEVFMMNVTFEIRLR